MHSVLNEVATKATNIKIVKIDVEKQPDLAKKYGIRSIPALLLLKGGTEVDRVVGLMSADEVIKKLIYQFIFISRRWYSK